MDIDQLISALGRPEAYPHPVETVDVVQTHISAVFLAGPLAYKIKKPVDFGFLDFTTLERRRHYCAEEVRLNRRLAPGVYRDVVPIVAAGDGVAVGAAGEPLEWAVRMERLPEERTFAALLERGDLDENVVTELAGRIAAFHAAAAAGEEISRSGGLETVARNVRENFEQVRESIGQTVSAPVFDRLERQAESDLRAFGPLIADRARRGVPREGHGDLHLAHVYWRPEAAVPADLVVVDCIEFNERFRYADPVADVAFMDMDLRHKGRPDLADAFGDAWFRASGDEEGRVLTPFYCAYRAVVRGKVDGFAARGAEIPAPERDRLRARARGYFLLALGAVAAPPERPALVIVSGLPGTGKSMIARDLAASGWSRLSTDEVRKGLAGLDPLADAAAGPDRGIYAPEWTERTYEAVRDRAQTRLLDGCRVVVEGTFLQESRRRVLLDLAEELRVPALVLEVGAPDSLVRSRLAQRRSDASDADWRVYLALRDRREPHGPRTATVTHAVDNSGAPELACSAVRDVLAGRGLA